ncbi:MAG: hypothetical protein H0Z34_11300 [Brevibacillus sp.]|nr:hypothetical protein [Brevibacillus sp.]
MHVTIKDQEYFFDNNLQAVQQIVEQINTTILNTGLLLSHVVVDGVEVFGDPEQYIRDNLGKIERIHVQLVTPTQFLLDVLHTGQEYLAGAIPQLSPLIDEFYAIPTSDSWHKLSQLAEGIQWFQQTESFIRETKSLPEWTNSLRDAVQFKPILSQLEEAVTQADATMIGDIIQYEILPRFENLSQLLREILTDGVEPSC